MTDADRDEGSRPSPPPELTGDLPSFVSDRIAGRPEGAPADDDHETVEALVELGLPEDEARRAVAEGRVPLALAARVLGDEPRHSLEEVAELAGMGADQLVQVLRAAGLAVPERFTDGDLEWAKMLGQLLENMPFHAVVRAARARGAALASVARSDLTLIREEILLPMRQAGADDLTVSVAMAETARAMNPLSRELLVHEYHRQLLNQLDSELSALLARSTGQEVDLAVGFVDLVGYTSLSARVDPTGLEEVLDAFEHRVLETVGGNDRVGVVKYLGDAAMLVAPDAPTLAGVMLDLVEPVADLEDAPLRGGVAFGGTLVREGDYFGQAVNLAARLTDLARPWTLLAAEELVDHLEERFSVKRIRPTRIRGVGVRRPLSVRRPE